MPAEMIRAMISRGYAVIDLETTGLNPGTDLILEIGTILVDSGEPTSPVSKLVRVPSVPPEITSLTGITLDDVNREGVPLPEAIQWLSNLVSGFPIVGHNFTRFDFNFIQEAVTPLLSQRPSLSNLLDRDRLIDTAALYKGWQLGRKLGAGEQLVNYQSAVLEQRVFGLSYNLPHCGKTLEVPLNGIQLHRAAGDVTLTHRVFLAMMERLLEE